MRTFDVLAIGEILVDFVAPEAEDLPSAHRFLRTAGGAPANVASAIARLGGKAAYVGSVGADTFGTYLRSVLEENGVDIRALRVVEERTSLAFVAKNRGGIPDFLFYRGADAVLRPEDIPLDFMAESSFLHVSSMGLMAEPARSATLFALERASEMRTVISVDPNLRPSSWPSLESALTAVAPLIEAADILKVNDEEARLLTGEHDPDASLRALGREHRLLVMTLGEQGCLWRWGAESGRVPAPRVPVADTTGAGDAFVGSLLTELARHGYSGDNFAALTVEHLVASLRFACAAAAISCLRPGAMESLPTRDEVEGLLIR